MRTDRALAALLVLSVCVWTPRLVVGSPGGGGDCVVKCKMTDEPFMFTEPRPGGRSCLRATEPDCGVCPNKAGFYCTNATLNQTCWVTTAEIDHLHGSGDSVA